MLHPAQHFTWCTLHVLNKQGDSIQPWHIVFPNVEPVCCSMSGSNCCFLTCIQVSQEAGEVVWYSHLLKNFPQFVVIHTVKGCVVLSVQNVLLGFKDTYLFTFGLSPYCVWDIVSRNLLVYLGPYWFSSLYGMTIFVSSKTLDLFLHHSYLIYYM